MRSFKGLKVGQKVKFRILRGTVSRSTYYEEGEGTIKDFTRFDGRPIGRLQPSWAIVESEGQERKLTPGNIV